MIEKYTNDINETYLDENECNEELKKHYCVYKHTNIINNKCYIGITSLNIKNRWRKNGKAYIRKDKKGRYEHPKFANAIKKYGWDNFDHEIIEEGFFTKDEIEKREIYWISYYDSFNNGYNNTEGGNISLWSQTDTGKKINSNLTKELWKDEQYIRTHTTPVKCIENEFIFKNANEVANLLHIDSTGIRSCCSKKQKSAGGYHWEWSSWDEYDFFCKQNSRYLEIFWSRIQIEKNYKQLSKLNKSIKQINIKPVLCIDKDIAYRGQVEASTITGINRDGIGLCCLGKQNFCGGYRWKFISIEDYAEYIKMEKADIPIPLIKSSQRIPVICVETGIIYKSIAEAYRETGIRHISECCNKLLETAGGYHWEHAILYEITEK